MENNSSIPELKSAIKETINSTSRVFGRQLETAVSEATDKIASEFVDTFYGGFETNKKSEDFNNIRRKTEAFFKALEEQEKQNQKLEEASAKLGKVWDKYKKTAIKSRKTLEEIDEEEKKFLTELKNSFFQTSTMKTYNQYINNINPQTENFDQKIMRICPH